MGVAQHGREDGRVGVVWRVMARVMARGRGELGGPGDGGQLEQVLRERVVVVRNTGEEWKVWDKRNWE